MSIDPRGVRYLDRLRVMLMTGIERGAKAARREGARALYPDSRNIIRPNTATGYVLAYREYLERLDDPNTKRLLFDARQAMQFDAILDDASPDVDFREMVHPPFDQLYVELSEPIAFGDPEPGHDDDLLRGFLFKANAMHGRVLDPSRVPSFAQDPNYRAKPEDYVELDFAEVVMFLSEHDDDGDISHVDRSFKLHLPTGMCSAPAASFCQSNSEEPTLVGHNDHDDVSDWPACVDKVTHKPRRYQPHEYFIAGMGGKAEDGERLADGLAVGRERRIGWYERAVRRYADLITYVFAYTAAKSVRIIEAPMTRQQRRWHEHRNMPPKPWHVVDVDPKFYSARDFEESSGRHVSYRHDVIGHFRVRDYKRKDGSAAHHISWVPPHQRGLANSLYIPSTHRVQGGKEISPVMREVYAHAEELGVPPPDSAAVSGPEE